MRKPSILFIVFFACITTTLAQDESWASRIDLYDTSKNRYFQDKNIRHQFNQEFTAYRFDLAKEYAKNPEDVHIRIFRLGGDSLSANGIFAYYTRIGNRSYHWLHRKPCKLFIIHNNQLRLLSSDKTTNMQLFQLFRSEPYFEQLKALEPYVVTNDIRID